MRIYIIAVCLLVLAGCGSQEEEPEVYLTEGLKVRPLKNFNYERTAERIRRGKYLTEGVLQCFTCHSERDWTKPGAPIIDSRKGAGAILTDLEDYRMVAPNITPDEETGGGRWTDDMYARAIREGIGHDGRALSFPMWFWSFANLSDEDLASVVVYLRTIPAVKNKLPKRKLSKEVQLALLSGPYPIYEPVASPDFNDKVERGKYLVKIADCSGCHTSWYSSVNPGLFGGGNMIKRMEDSAFSTNITVSPSGLSYDENIFIEIIRTGKSGTLNRVMPWIAFKNMTDEDLKDIYAFLKTVEPVNHFVNNISPPQKCKACGQTHGFGEANSEIEIVSADVNRDNFDEYTGKYDYRGVWIVNIFRDGDKLMIKDAEHKPAELIPVSQSEFRTFNLSGKARFLWDSTGKVTHLIVREVDDVLLNKLQE
jgi:mono/diheme cytochrome c family protein